MNVIICDICGENIRIHGHELRFTKRDSIFDDIENTYDVCDDCYNKMLSLWNKNRASFKVTVSK